MAETGFTPIQLYRTATGSAVPSASNLTDGELAINTNDGKLFFKNSSGAVTQIASAGGSTGTVSSVGGTGAVSGITLSGTVTTSGNLTLGGALTGVFPDPSLIGSSATVASGTFQVAIAGGITITLPASPSAGDFVGIKDGTGAAATTNFTVARNGSNIASSATDLTFDKNFAEIVMTYVNSTIGWSV
jgi:hypothetical protein